MAKIYAPNKKHTGITAGVRFVEGEGETNDKYLLDWFKKRGYTVGKQQEEAPGKDAKMERPGPDNGKDKK